jgi:hypothetical protein
MLYDYLPKNFKVSQEMIESKVDHFEEITGKGIQAQILVNKSR